MTNYEPVFLEGSEGTKIQWVEKGVFVKRIEESCEGAMGNEAMGQWDN